MGRVDPGGRGIGGDCQVGGIGNPSQMVLRTFPIRKVGVGWGRCRGGVGVGGVDWGGVGWAWVWVCGGVVCRVRWGWVVGGGSCRVRFRPGWGVWCRRGGWGSWWGRWVGGCPGGWGVGGGCQGEGVDGFGQVVLRGVLVWGVGGGLGFGGVDLGGLVCGGGWGLVVVGGFCRICLRPRGGVRSRSGRGWWGRIGRSLLCGCQMWWCRHIVCILVRGIV